MSYIFCILKNEDENSHLEWSLACDKLNLAYYVVDITRADWFENIICERCDCYLARPNDKASFFKTLYDERIYIINKILHKPIFPTLNEIIIYENKKLLCYFLKAQRIPHPQTWIFYHKEEALNFAESSSYPIVGKTSIGASGSGVRIIRSRGELIRYIDRAFSKKGVRRSFGPNLRKVNKKKRVINALRDIPAFYQKQKKGFLVAISDPQRWFVILQEFILCDYEWRVVKIGDSYFAHKKVRSGKNEKFSGTSKVSWSQPSEALLNFAWVVCEKCGLHSHAIDIFEPEPGRFMVNEMQAFFGSESSHQMIVNGVPGRYVLRDSKWIFEEGNFNTNNSYDLRLEHVVKLFRENRL